MTNKTLKENQDFIFEKRKNRAGFELEVAVLQDGTVLGRTFNPRYNQIVLLEKDNHFQFVRIIGGQYEQEGRISNVWQYYLVQEDGSNGEKVQGYGYFYELPASVA